MRLRVTFKCPDAVGDAIDRAVGSELLEIEGVDDGEREQLRDSRREKLSDELGRWIEYDEYLSVDFDTDAGTATVVERK